MDKNDLNRKSSNYLGKIRSNFLGTEFTVYDDGENPSKTKQYDKIRDQLEVITYVTNSIFHLHKCFTLSIEGKCTRDSWPT